MNKKIIIIVLITPFVLLMLWTGSLFATKNSGVDIKLPVMGYDPRDLLSGHYIQYQIDWEKADCSQFEDGICHKDKFCKDARWGRQCRFYVPEEYAGQLDKLFWQRNSEDMIFEVVYSYSKNRKAIAKQLLINNKDWKEMIK